MFQTCAYYLGSVGNIPEVSSIQISFICRTFHALFMSDTLDYQARWNFVFGVGTITEALSDSDEFHSALSSAQSVLMFAFSFHMGLLYFRKYNSARSLLSLLGV